MGEKARCRTCGLQLCKQTEKKEPETPMNQTLRIFRKNYKNILLFALLIVLPVYVVQEFVIVPALPQDLKVDDTRAVWYTLSISLISLFLYVYRIAVIRMSYDTLEGKQTGIADLLEFSVKLWPKILLTVFLYAISVSFGLMFFVFPGLVLFTLYTFYQYVSVQTGLWGRKSLFLSSLYARKSMGKAAAIAFGTAIIRYAFSYIISTVSGWIVNSAISAVFSIFLFFIAELVFSLIDIFVVSYLFHTTIAFDPETLQKKKSVENAEH